LKHKRQNILSKSVIMPIQVKAMMTAAGSLMCFLYGGPWLIRMIRSDVVGLIFAILQRTPMFYC